MNKEYLAKDPSAAFTRIIALITLEIVLGWAVLKTESWLLKTPAWIAWGFVINGWIQLWHDCWHGTLFQDAWKNRALGHVISFFIGIPYEPARHGHMLHHRFNRTDRDPDAYNAGRRSFGLYWRYYNILFFGLILSPLHFCFIYPLRYFSGKKLLIHCIQILITLTLYLGIAYWAQSRGYGSTLLQVWVIPWLFASPWHGIKSVADHFSDTWKGDRFHAATTVTSNRIVTYLWNGLNYHLEHHLYPQVPGSKLERLHNELKDELAAHDVAIHTSYANIFFQALLRGPQIIDEETDFNRITRRVEIA